MKLHEPVTLTRDLAAIEIPAGTKTSLLRGSVVVVTQALGGSLTIRTTMGYLYRVDGADADALGPEYVAGMAGQVKAVAPTKDGVVDAEWVREQAWAKLKTCFDPEIPINVVDLGLVYACDLTPVEGGVDIAVRMTLTAPGCGMGGVLQTDAQSKLSAISGVKSAKVDIVFEPAWDRKMMSEAAQLQLGMY